jgi:hypothetical protein
MTFEFFDLMLILWQAPRDMSQPQRIETYIIRSDEDAVALTGMRASRSGKEKNRDMSVNIEIIRSQ